MLTPLYKADKLAKKLGLKADLYLKREDLHPLGSHKGRSIPPMIERYQKEGIKNFIISSSGNAALAAALFIQNWNKKNSKNLLTLTIFVGEKIDKEKFASLLSFRSCVCRVGGAERGISVVQTKNPKQQAIQIDKSGQAKNLRQSTDDTALVGYLELTKELSEIRNLSAVFIPTSSGTTAQGLYEGFQKLNINPQIHIVQTTACHPIVDAVASSETARQSLTTPSLASAIVDKVAHRKNKVAEIIKNSHGNGWIADNEEIQQAINILEETEQIKISPNSALSLVGFLKSIQTGEIFNGSIACILTGK